MTRARWQSAFAAALFALHPLHVESVAWLAERKDVLSTLFWMLTMWAYAGYVTQKETVAAGDRFPFLRYLLVIVMFALGLMAKPMLVTLPFVLLLMDYWPLRRVDRGISMGQTRAGAYWRLIREKWALFALTAISCVVTLVVQNRTGAVAPFERMSIGPRFYNAAISYTKYIGRTFWPRHMAPFYPYSQRFLLWQVAGAAILLICISVAAYRLRRRYPYGAVGWAWFIGTLVPVIGIVQVGAQALADRYTYVPLIGTFIIIAWGVPELIAGWRYRRSVLMVAACASIGALMVCTRLQASLWRDSVTLFTHTLDVTSDNGTIHNNMGAALVRRGRLDEAIPHYLEAIRINPGDHRALNNMGSLLSRQGKFDEAIEWLSASLQIDPRFTPALNNMGAALLKQNKMADALQYLSEAVRLDPDYVDAHYNLGLALVRTGRFDEAIGCFSEAIRLNPQFVKAYVNMGGALAEQGKLDTAFERFSEAVRLDPQCIEAQYNMGRILANQGRWAEAAVYFGKVVAQDPGNAAAHTSLGYALSTQGEVDKAIEHYRAAIQIDPQNPQAHTNLGNELLVKGSFDEAIVHYREAVRLAPGYAQAHNSLGVALIATRKPDEAIEQFRKAVQLDPNHAGAHSNLGKAFSTRGEYQQAIDHYSEVVRINPNDANAYCNLGTAMSARGDHRMAVAQFEKALQLDPNHADARKRLDAVKADLEQTRDQQKQ